MSIKHKIRNQCRQYVITFITTILLFNCSTQKQVPFAPKEVYKSNTLVVTQITENTFQHTSYLQTNDFGNVPCNGLIVRSKHEVVVFDTPTNDSASIALIHWVTETLHSNIVAIIPTHFHDDCLGGLTTFHQQGIPSHAYARTIELAKENNFSVPQHGFQDSLQLKVGDESVMVKFFGEGHTRDNVVGYFSSEEVLFGGCLIKEAEASKGYLGDANVVAWSATVERIKKAYPNIKIVVPGHGEYGGQKLLDYTINLFKAP